MRLTCRAGVAVDEVLRSRLGELQEFVERLERRLRARDQHVGRVIGEANVAEAVHAVGELLQMRLRGERIVRRERDRVAVALRPDDFVQADRAGRAALVDDDDRLPQRLAELVLQRASHDVGVPAGRKRHHHGDRARRIGLRGSRQRRSGKEGRRQQDAPNLPHANVPSESVIEAVTRAGFR